MSETQLIRTQTMLDVLGTAAGLMSDPVLHAMMCARLGEKITLSEFEALRAHAERERWITGVRSQFTDQMRWKITDSGRVARSEM